MKRFLRLFLLALSVLLAIASALMAVRSNRCIDSMSYTRRGVSYGASTYVGGMNIARTVSRAAGDSDYFNRVCFLYGPNPAGFTVVRKPFEWKTLGFGCYHNASHAVNGGPGSPPAYEAIGIGLPFWFLTLVFLCWPLLAGRRALRRRKRLAANCCAVCGYDLRASPDRCPECGTAVQKSP